MFYECHVATLPLCSMNVIVASLPLCSMNVIVATLLRVCCVDVTNVYIAKIVWNLKCVSF